MMSEKLFHILISYGEIDHLYWRNESLENKGDLL